MFKLMACKYQTVPPGRLMQVPFWTKKQLFRWAEKDAVKEKIVSIYPLFLTAKCFPFKRVKM